MLCPSDTPEGEGCGLVKNLALMTHVTTDEEESPLIRLSFALGVEDLRLLNGEDIHNPTSCLIFINGQIIGIHKKPQVFLNSIRRLRRSGKIGEFVSIFYNQTQNSIQISTDAGRICRPLIIVENQQPKITNQHIEVLS